MAARNNLGFELSAMLRAKRTQAGVPAPVLGPRAEPPLRSQQPQRQDATR